MSEVKICWSSFCSWIFPTRCALCDLLGDAPICAHCRQEFEPIDMVRREYNPLSPLELTVNLYPYTGRPGQAIKRLKYSRATSLSEPLSAMLLEGIERLGLLDYDLAVPVPIHWKRRCHRGFNQAELLCQRMPAVSRSLRRIKSTRQQAGLKRDDRMTNLAGAFRASPEVAGKSVLLIDDVLTSGFTMRECAKTLRQAGAVRVAALAFAGEQT